MSPRFAITTDVHLDREVIDVLTTKPEEVSFETLLAKANEVLTSLLKSHAFKEYLKTCEKGQQSNDVNLFLDGWGNRMVIRDDQIQIFKAGKILPLKTEADLIDFEDTADLLIALRQLQTVSTFIRRVQFCGHGVLNMRMVESWKKEMFRNGEIRIAGVSMNTSSVNNVSHELMHRLHKMQFTPSMASYNTISIDDQHSLLNFVKYAEDKNIPYLVIFDLWPSDALAINMLFNRFSDSQRRHVFALYHLTKETVKQDGYDPELVNKVNIDDLVGWDNNHLLGLVEEMNPEKQEG